MGDFLSTPIKTKEVEDKEDIGVSFIIQIRYGACGMQGWRKRMEDSHIADLNIKKDTHLFGVFDGHGGKEVAQLVKKYFVKE